MPFSPIKKQKISEQVAASIRDAIMSGQMRPSEALPSERDLAERFHVNRSSIREALHRLEAWGLIEIRQGNATLVRDFLVTAGPELLPFVLAPAGLPDPKIVRDLLGIRSMILAWTARQAAHAPPPRDLERLAWLTRELEQPGHDAEELQVLDFDFFQELVRLTDNRVLALLANTIRHVYLARPALFTPLYDPRGFDPQHHRRACDAIAQGDAVAAAAAMEAYAQLALAPSGPPHGGALAAPTAPDHEPGGRP
jgi:DNA-binding FadR family transcriptional regulator